MFQTHVKGQAFLVPQLLLFTSCSLPEIKPNHHCHRGTNLICNPLKLCSFSPSFPPCLCYSNNIVLESSDKYSLNEDGSELIIKDVRKVDEGDYTCIAKNKAGEKAEEVSLNVYGKRIHHV